MTVTIRALREDELAEADRIFRVAFGTFVGLPDPAQFAGDSDWIRTNWRRDPTAAFAAEVDGRLAGSNFATDWGSVGCFGPLSVRPDLWGRGVARPLLESVMACFTRWRTHHAGLFTFAESPKHIGLYERFGFYPRFLTAIMTKPASAATRAHWTRYSEVPPHDRAQHLATIRELTDTVFTGLDVGHDIGAIADQKLGDTLLVWDHARLVGVALCHVGAGTQAGSGTCYVKFAAARPGDGAAFEHLLDTIETFAASQSAGVAAGVNLGRTDAYKRMQARGYRTVIQGVAMHRPNEDAYARADAYVIDDWR